MKVDRERPSPASARETAAPSTSTPTTPGQPAAPAARGWSVRGAAPVAAPASDGFAAVAPRRGTVGSGVAPAAPSRFRDPAFAARLDADTLSKAHAGNQVTMLFDGVNSFAERDRMIDGARKSVCLQTFILSSDDTGMALAHKLVAKAKEGVQVRVIYDGVGSKDSDKKIFEVLRQGGVEVLEHTFLKDVGEVNHSWHEKHLIVDGAASVEGGMNIANEYALGGSGKLVFSRGTKGTEAWRDADVKVVGPAVNDASRSFLANWKSLGGKVSAADEAALLPTIPAQANGTTVRVISSKPTDSARADTTHKLYLHAIEHAQKSITIENAYFLPPDDLRKALVGAAQRGVQVKVLTNSRQSNDLTVVADASRYFYDELEKAGVKIYEKQGGTLHAKTACFDGELSIVGSVNLNGRSANLDAEDAVVIDGPQVGQQLESRFTSGLSQAREITLGELGNEAFTTNLRQWALHSFAWTF